MPKGPHGQMRPADAIGLAVMIRKIATGEIDDTHTDPLAEFWFTRSHEEHEDVVTTAEPSSISNAATDGSF